MHRLEPGGSHSLCWCNPDLESLAWPPLPGRRSPLALPPLLFKHSSQSCRRNNKMEFGLPCFPGSYLTTFQGPCLNPSDKNMTNAESFCCFVFLIIFLCDFVPQRERGSTELSVRKTSSLQVRGTEIRSTATHQTGKKHLHKPGTRRMLGREREREAKLWALPWKM